MSEFDIEAAIVRITGHRPNGNSCSTCDLVRSELRAVVLAGRREALVAVSRQHANGWTGERGDGWAMGVAQCERAVRDLPDA